MPLNDDSILALINQTFDLEQKLDDHPASRNLGKMKHIFEENGYTVFNPIHEKYEVSRTDCEANIVGDSMENLVITKVIKPVILQKDDYTGMQTIIQRAIVIVEGK